MKNLILGLVLFICCAAGSAQTCESVGSLKDGGWTALLSTAPHDGTKVKVADVSGIKPFDRVVSWRNGKWESRDGQAYDWFEKNKCYYWHAVNVEAWCSEKIAAGQRRVYDKATDSCEWKRR
jgi:hypothetical protein